VAWYHVNSCDCPIGCCDCGSTSDRFVYLHYNPFNDELEIYSKLMTADGLIHLDTWKENIRRCLCC